MSSRKILHDRLLILQVMIAIMLGIFNILSIFVKVNNNKTSAVIRYDAYLGISGFNSSDTWRLYLMAFFVIIVLTTCLLIVARTYHLRRSLAITTINLTLIVLVFNIIASTAILNLSS